MFSKHQQALGRLRVSLHLEILFGLFVFLSSVKSRSGKQLFFPSPLYGEKHHYYIFDTKYRIISLLPGQKTPPPSSSYITLTHMPLNSCCICDAVYWSSFQSIRLTDKCSSIPIRKPIVFTTVELLAAFICLKHLRKKMKMVWRSMSGQLFHDSRYSFWFAVF